MSFDDRTRTLLANMVAACRDHLVEDVTDQLQSTYGLYPDGESLDVARTEQERRAAEDLRELLAYYAANAAGKPKQRKQSAYQRLVREIGFTALNRLAALRLCEERGLVIECVRRGMASDGFQLYDRIANGGLGNRYRTYRAFLEGIYDELALDLGVLFDRTTPHAHVFPSETALTAVLDRLNDSELARRNIWQQDETIGWIYQYYNDPAERKKMRTESRAPRNSRELAVRNQFFTPRYVVEFLTDNTLGRLWYEIRRGNTALPERCRYFVRRPNEVFLEEGEEVPPSSSPRTQGEDSADDGLATPYYIPFRPPKDPRALKLLDPAVGSAHFLLYAFDLFTLIYAEAWASPGSAYFEETGRTLREDYPDLDDLRRAVPGLILRYNLHGIDIDPRAVQIANLALWLRAQRAYQEQGLSAAQRPAITKSNIVTAEPMPGDRTLLDEFVQDLQPPVLGDLVRVVFEKMDLAGEAGSLLKIEEDLAGAIAEAKRQWQKLGTEKQLALFAQPPAMEQQELFDLSGISDEAFWETAEERVLDVLEAYAAETDMRHQMFAEDTAQGFAFIDLCRQMYDVAVMNPPFGDTSAPSKPYIEDTYADTKNDVYKAFVECFQDRLISSGLLGIISSRTGFFLGQSQDWRERIILRLYRPLVLADFGHGVLDAMVETAAYVLRTLTISEDENLTLHLLQDVQNVSIDRHGYFSIPKYQKQRDGIKRHQAIRELSRLVEAGYLSRIEGHYARFEPQLNRIKQASPPTEISYSIFTCFRVLDADDKSSVLANLVSEVDTPDRFDLLPDQFTDLPGTPFAYWAEENLRELFKTSNPFESQGRVARVGDHPGDGFRYLRLWWEVSSGGAKRDWRSYQKGGSHSKYYYDIHLLADWDDDRQTYRGFFGRPGRSNEQPSNFEFFFRRGLTWPRRTTSSLSMRPLNTNCIFADKGPAVFVKNDTPHELLSLLALTNSQIFSDLIEFQLAAADAAARSYEVGIVQRTPVPTISEEGKALLADRAYQAWSIKFCADTSRETSHAFQLPALVQKKAQSIDESFHAWSVAATDQNRELDLIQAEIDQLCLDLYGIERQSRSAEKADADDIRSDQSISLDEDDEPADLDIDVLHHVLSLLSWCVGVAIGRFDLRASKDPDLWATASDPFDPLPVCPPGMLVGPNGLPATPDNIVSEAWLRARPNAITLPPDGSFDGPATIPDEAYPLPIAWDGILVDDPGLGEQPEPHPSDIARRVRGVLALLWPENHADIEAEACEILGVRDLRDYFSRPTKFFADHLARYTKSRRKAPIYWPLSTASGRYTLWLYYHRLTDQTLYTAVNRYVAPKIDAVQRHVAAVEEKLNRTSGAAATALRDDLDEQHAFLTELRAFRDDLLAVAALPYKPDLNDGVIINAAPLHKLFSLSRWRNDTEKIWEKLQAGEYDWAHMALVLWPERVRDVCKRDKSIAIGHGLEELYEEKPG